MLYIRLLLALASTIIARLARNYASILYIYEFQYDVARRSAGYSLRKTTKNREWFARYSDECGLCAKFGFPKCFLCKMFLCTTINFSLSNMRLAVNSRLDSGQSPVFLSGSPLFWFCRGFTADLCRPELAY